MLAPARSLVLAAALLSPACACKHRAEAAPSAPAPAAARDAAPLPSMPGASRAAPAPRTIPGEYLITVTAGAGEALVRERFGPLGIARLQALGPNLFLVKLEPDPGLPALEQVRAQDGRVTAVQPNYAYRGVN